MAIKLTLDRLGDDTIQTMGSMAVMDGTNVLFACVTLELPFKDNKKMISCIPRNTTYPCRKRKSSKTFNYPHILVQNVPNRSGICIHIINYSRQLKGCIGVGKNFADLDKDGLKDITSSKDTLEKLLSFLPDKFDIEIR